MNLEEELEIISKINDLNIVNKKKVEIHMRKNSYHNRRLFLSIVGGLVLAPSMIWGAMTFSDYVRDDEKGILNNGAEVMYKPVICGSAGLSLWLFALFRTKNEKEISRLTDVLNKKEVDLRNGEYMHTIDRRNNQENIIDNSRYAPPADYKIRSSSL